MTTLETLRNLREKINEEINNEQKNAEVDISYIRGLGKALSLAFDASIETLKHEVEEMLGGK